MSTLEIVAELDKLSQPELEVVDHRLHELLASKPRPTKQNWGEALKGVAGSASGLPSDFAQNHDHYLHGLPKR